MTRRARDSASASFEKLLHGARALAATVLGRERAARRHYAAALAAGAGARQLLEIARMAHLFGGFPRAIQGLRALGDVFVAAGIAPPADPAGTPRRSRSRGELARDRRRGERLFRRIYGASSDTVLARLDVPADGFASWVLEDAYGRVLTRPGLSARARELLAVAALAALRCPLQLESHMRGARNLGAAARDVARMRAAGQSVGSRKSGARQTLRRRRQ